MESSMEEIEGQVESPVERAFEFEVIQELIETASSLGLTADAVTIKLSNLAGAPVTFCKGTVATNNNGVPIMFREDGLVVARFETEQLIFQDHRGFHALVRFSHMVDTHTASSLRLRSDNAPSAYPTGVGRVSYKNEDGVIFISPKNSEGKHNCFIILSRQMPGGRVG